MDDNPPDSPPLPRGTYNFNFDDFDENTNPFETKNRMDSSPDRNTNNSNPFQSRSKLSSSPPASIAKEKINNNDNYDEIDDPFKSKSKLGSSPPRDNGPADDGNGAMHNDNDDSFKTAIESPEKEVKSEKPKGLKTKAKVARDPQQAEPLEDVSRETDSQDGGTEPAENVPKPQKSKPAKSTTSPKKSTIKKPKVKSKFKPPANFGVKASDGDVVILAPPRKDSKPEDDIEIFAPPGKPVEEVESGPAVDNDELEAESRTREPISCENMSDLPSQMPGLEVMDHPMMESVHDFGAGEMPMEAREGFVPASEVFNEDDSTWDMLEKIASEEVNQQGRDSLYTKFDPLAENEVPDNIDRRESDSGFDQNCNEEDLLLMNTPPATKSSVSGRGQSRHPAARVLQDQVEGDGAPREVHSVDKILFSPGRTGEQKLEHEEVYFDAREYPFNSPETRVGQQGDSDVEKMNMANTKKHGSNSDTQDSIVQLVQVLKYSQSDWNRMKQDLELDYNARILNKEKEWSRKLADRDKKISHLDEQVLLLRSTNEDMRLVVAEFEKTISQLQAEKVKTTSESQQSYDDVVKERDQALDDLQSVETAFSDLHQRYERTKGVVEGLKKNEDILKKCVQDYQVKLKTAEDKVVAIRQQAEDKLDQAGQEIDKVRKVTTAEVARLEAALKKSELKIQGLERNLDQKVKENEELTAICDELIAKVGGD